MSKKMIDAENIRLGKMRYFDAEHKRSEIPIIDAYVFMVKVNGIYVNPFDLTMELPVFDRVPYPNYTRDGEPYGSKIKLAQGEIKTGPCVILDNVDIGRFYGEKLISTDMLEEFMLSSDKFFIDRIELYENVTNKKNLFWALDNRLATIRQRDVSQQYLEDLEKLQMFNEYMNSFKEENIHFGR